VVTGVLHDARLDQVLIFRALKGWGDALVVVPALRALRVARPGAHIAVVGPPVAAAYFRPFSTYVDEFVPFPGWPGLPDLGDDVAAATRLLTGMQDRRADLALQLHGSGLLTNPIVAMLGARRMAGHHLPEQWCPDPQTFRPWTPSVPEPLRPLRLLAHLGLVPADADPSLELPITDENMDAARSMVPADPYAVVNVGASHRPRRWPTARFAAVADHLVSAGLPVVLTGGPGDATRAAEVAGRATHRLHDLTGRTTHGQLAAVVDGATLVVTNDTGVSHVAVARRRPSVTIFCWSDLDRWGPLDRERHAVVGPSVAYPPAEVAPARCLRDGCARCMPAGVGPAIVPAVEEVLAVVDGQLAHHAGAR
jgi:ADP-heptose:LPS heptosyltransferase